MSIVSKIITVTPECARRHLGNMVHNRPLSQANVRRYLAEMEIGRWGMTGQGLIFDPKGRLLDGQHRLHAVIKYGKPVQMLAIYGVSPEMFALIDAGNKRTVSDVLDTKNRNTVAGAAKFLWREMSGATWWNNNVKLCPADAIKVVDAHPALEESAVAVRAHGKAHAYITGSALTYCHYRCGTENSQRRAQFFESFASGADLGARSPILALRTHLTPIPGSRFTDQHRIASFILAWHMYLAGRQCSFIRMTKDVPNWSAAL